MVPDAASTASAQIRLHQKRPRETELPSPPRSYPTPEQPSKRQKTRRQRVPHNREHHPRTRRKGAYQEKPYQEEPHVVQARALRPPQFWDNLSHIPLVKAVLQELDQRNQDIPALCSSSSLAGTDLLRFARHGGPDLSDLRGFPEHCPQMPQGRRGPVGARGGISKAPARGRASAQHSRGSQGSRSQAGAGTSAKTKSSSPYDAAFRQHLIDFKIYPINHILASNDLPSAPDNLQDIIDEICGNSRASLEPSTFGTEQHERFWRSYILSTSEEAQSRTLDMIEGDTLAPSAAHVKRGPVKLTNLSPLVPANFVPGNPDRAYGARPELLDGAVRDQLGTLVLPTSAEDILSPNFIVHVKGPDGKPRVAKIQAVYDGALAARGMQALWEFGREGDGEDDVQTAVARTITCTFADGILRMFAVARRHGGARLQRLQPQTRLPPEDIEYVTSRIGSWLMAEKLDDFRDGALAFRNGLEWARRQRDRLIEQANRKARIAGAGSAQPAGQNSTDPII
ncbi:hypothetical protein diail_3293 [Diaporthe ilicicola]|nr:hypothetical protein diail_3293 [Diaporthe ilicicola]